METTLEALKDSGEFTSAKVSPALTVVHASGAWSRAEGQLTSVRAANGDSLEFRVSSFK